jgi:hypothetical protein
MAKKSQNQQVPIKKPPEPWPPISNGSATTVHSATAQVRGWRAGDGTRERMRQRGDFFNEAQNSSHEGIEPETSRCYSGASAI